MRVLTWNLYHGRSLPPAGRELSGEFAALLSSWEWDAALLQEAPPWWPALLARASGAEQRLALTSRNAVLPVRRALARRWPELMRSNGGGCNAILARAPILEHRALRLRTWPERRVAQLAKLHGGTYVANYHASTRPPLAEGELARLLACALQWARESPLIVGGDFNLRSPRAPEQLAHVAGRDVDHLLACGLEPVAEAQVLDHGVTLAGTHLELSDHPPLAVSLGAPGAQPDLRR